MTTDETIEIKPCPLCGGAHTYFLEVQRSPYLFGAGGPGNIRRMKRLFTCPDKNESFESILEMVEDERGTITKLNIGAIVKEKKNGRKK